MDEEAFRALADPTRRKLLDRLFDSDGQSLGELVEGMSMTRFGVMKHLRLLEAAGLVTTHRSGREKFHYLNPVPIQLIADRWIGKYARPWAEAMTTLKHTLEANPVAPKHIYETYIRTTPERLWEAITDGQLTKQYFHETELEAEIKPGAAYCYRMADGRPALEGEILEVEPARRLVMTFSVRYSDEGKADSPTRVTWEIEPMGDVCRLRLTHDEFESETWTYRSVEFGWNTVLSGLKTLLETGVPLEIP